jgi:hypothetical protein
VPPAVADRCRVAQVPRPTAAALQDLVSAVALTLL